MLTDDMDDCNNEDIDLILKKYTENTTGFQFDKELETLGLMEYLNTMKFTFNINVYDWNKNLLLDLLKEKFTILQCTEIG